MRGARALVLAAAGLALLGPAASAGTGEGEGPALPGLGCHKALAKLLADTRARPPLAFLHLTKAGGSNVEAVLKREIERRGLSRAEGREALWYGEVKGAWKVPKNLHQVTMLREPTSRFASYVFFRKYDVKSKYRKHAKNIGWTMECFSNLYTRVLMGCEIGARNAHCAKSQCEKAKAKLRSQFALVGTSERMLESIALIGYLYRFQEPPLFGRVNVQEGSPGVKGLPQKILPQIVKENKCDIELHAIADQMLTDTIACLGQGFQDYLENFTAAQRQHEKDNPGCEDSCVKYGESHRAGHAVE